MDIVVTMPSIIFKAKGILFSIPSTNAQSIIQMPKVTKVPNTVEAVRGIVKHRNEIYNLIDFRKKLSFQSLQEELEELKISIDKCEQEYITWFDEIQNSVTENRPLKFTMDTTKCSLENWYNDFSSGNIFINEILKKFDIPHETIYDIVQKIEELKESNQLEEANSLIKEIKEQELSQIKSFFDKVRETIELHSKERVILFNNNNNKFAIAVDQIESVEEIKKIETKTANDQLLNFGNQNFITGLGQDKHNNMVILVSEKLLI